MEIQKLSKKFMVRKLNDIDIDKIYTKEFSTKKGNTGLGLWEVKNFVDNNPNFSLETTLENNCFKHTLYIL